MLTRHAEIERPVNHALPAWDIATGLLAVSALLAGLRRRTVEGCGSRIDLGVRATKLRARAGTSPAGAFGTISADER